ncbi:MAG: dTDP-glucose 4,6-dehydratase [Clostridia bacterium]|nr:dTDP-glucose 4,6-dehydratase [Clostridia bacterium]
MTIIVTGGAGFIGSNFIFYLKKNHPDYRVVAFDALTYAGNRMTLMPLDGCEGFRFVCGDICDPYAVDRLLNEEKPDAIVNFAAESHVDRSIDTPDVFVKTNILGTATLLDACLKHGIARFHQISTDEVYGDLPLDSSTLFTEDTPLRASSPYSASKASADLLVQAYYRTYGLPVTISRSGNNYGAYQFPEKLIPLMIVKALKGETLPVYGDGKNVRDWLYVEDHCRAIDLILHHGTPGEIYNVGAHQEIRNIDLVRMLCQILAIDEARITFVADRKGHDLRYALDAAKLTAQLGWKPKTMFDTGLQKTVDWYLRHRSWWDAILTGAYRTAYEGG